MSIKTLITDPATDIQANVVDDCGYKALVVATRELREYTTRTYFFSNSTYGNNLNQNISFGGVPEVVYKENIEWATSTIVGGSWDFNEAVIVYAGAKSIDATGTANNDVAQLAKGASLIVSGYVAITGYIYLTSWSALGTKAIEIYGYNTTTSSVVGASVNIGNYINKTLLGVWQKFAISLSDMNLVSGTINALRIRTVDLGPGDPPDYYLDNIQFEQTGLPLEYTIIPRKGTWFYLEEIKMSIADAYAGTLLNGTMPSISYNAFLGVATLASGIVYQRIQNNQVRESINIRQIYDLLKFPGADLTNFISDGTNTYLNIKMKLLHPEILKSENGDKLRVLIQDNLSGLLLCTLCVGGREENKQTTCFI